MSEQDAVVYDWLRDNNDPDTRALRAHTLEMLEELEAGNKRLKAVEKEVERLKDDLKTNAQMLADLKKLAREAIRTLKDLYRESKGWHWANPAGCFLGRADVKALLETKGDGDVRES